MSQKKDVLVTAGICLIMALLVGAWLFITEREEAQREAKAALETEQAARAETGKAALEVAINEACAEDHCFSEAEPVKTVAPLKPDVVRTTRKGSKGSLAIDSKLELLEVPPTEPVRTTDEVKATLKTNAKFRGALHDGICLVLNDFTRAAGTVKIQLVVPWGGGTQSVRAAVIWKGALEREFYDHELTPNDRAAAATEMERALAKHLADAAGEDVFPARGGGRAVTATITRTFSWDKTTQEGGCSVADAGSIGISR